MLPFFTIFGKTIPLYGLCTVVGVLLALGLILLCCPRFALNRENGVYLFVMGAVGAAIGAKMQQVYSSKMQSVAKKYSSLRWTGRWKIRARAWL